MPPETSSEKPAVFACVINIGCRLNQAEGDSLRRWLLDQGCELVNAAHETLDIVVVNTCAVTQEAERTSLNRIRRMAKRTPKPHLIVTGCMAERAPARLKDIAGVDEVIGITAKARLIADRMPLPDRSRAFVKVQDGCRNRCSFCVVSRLRGLPVSKSATQILSEVDDLRARGYREIVLTGLNLGSYGQEQNGSLAELVAAVSDHIRDGSTRLRLGSLEPDTITQELIRELTARARLNLCPHLHIPVQSGDDRILQAMNRRYQVAEYRRVVEMLLAQIPDINIGTDVLVGFPGEDESAFAATWQLLTELPFGYLHVFPFSPRPGTAAGAQPDSVPWAVKRERVSVLRKLAAEHSRRYRQKFVGQIRPAVTLSATDEAGEAESDVALTDNYIRVKLPAPTAKSCIVPVRIVRVRGEETSAVPALNPDESIPSPAACVKATQE